MHVLYRDNLFACEANIQHSCNICTHKLQEDARSGYGSGRADFCAWARGDKLGKIVSDFGSFFRALIFLFKF